MRRFNGSVLSLVRLLAIAFLFFSGTPKSNAGYQSGTHDGFFWQLWTDDQSGSVNYSNGAGGNYSVSWNYSGNFTCGKGWSTGSLTRIVGYNCGAYNHGGGGGGVFAYYGWSRNPLREYYVNEMWGTGRPTGTYMGTINSDGGTYDLYRSQRINAPSIDGTQTFWQTYSTRTAEAPTGQNRVITFANHATAWANAGWGLGTDMSPAAFLLTEAYGGSNGNANATVWLAGNSGGGGGGPIANGTYRIIARHSGKAMDASNNGTANGTQIVQWTYGGGNNQRWTVTNRGNNQYSIIGVQSGRAIDINNSGVGNGTKVQLWDYGGGANQKFTFTATSGGYYRITPTHSGASGACLDVSGVSQNDGALVQLWSYGGGNNQQWVLQAP